MRYLLLLCALFLNSNLWAAAYFDEEPCDRWEERTLAALTSGNLSEPIDLTTPIAQRSRSSVRLLLENPDDPSSSLAVLSYENAHNIYAIAKDLGLESAFPRVLRAENITIPGQAESFTGNLLEFVKFASPSVQARIPTMHPDIQEVASFMDQFGALNLQDLLVHGKSIGRKLIDAIVIPNLSPADFDTHLLALMFTRPGDCGSPRNIMLQLTEDGKFKFVIVDLDEFFVHQNAITQYPYTLFLGPGSLSAAAKDKIVSLDTRKLVDTFFATQKSATKWPMTPNTFGQIIEGAKSLATFDPTISIHDLYVLSILFHPLARTEFAALDLGDTPSAYLELQANHSSLVIRLKDVRIRKSLVSGYFETILTSAIPGFEALGIPLLEYSGALSGQQFLCQWLEKKYADESIADKSAATLYGMFRTYAATWLPGFKG